MKPSLQTRLSQQLTLTPQLRQAIKLLQLSAMQLEQEINAAVESNPLLELLDDGDREPLPADVPSHDDRADAEARADGSAGEEVVFDEASDFDWGTKKARGAGDEDYPNREETAAAPLDLHEHLIWQLRLSHLSDRDMAIGEAVIEAIEDDGYLGIPLEDVQAALLPECPAQLPEIEAVLHLIQRFDPVGVGARSLSECLNVQLGLVDPETPGLALARRLCAEHLDGLARHGPAKLAAQLRLSGEEMDTAVALLKSLDPKPGAKIGDNVVEYIVPDAIAYRQNSVWKVVTNTGNQPRLGINQHYEGLIGKSRREDDSYLRGQLQEARWLIKSLETRADTLLRVARCIVRRQTGFLEHGEQAMRPLTLREVADELALHESTISRVTTRKYLRTPRGTFEFKYFFSSGIATDSGGGASATAIQAMLRRLMESEDPRSPLSDAKLAQLLKEDGIPVARRTVAKYREAMKIPPSSERQRL